MSGVATCQPPREPIWRVHRVTLAPFDPAPWIYCGSGRFDDPLGARLNLVNSRFRVVSCTSSRSAAFAETIAQLGRREAPLDNIRTSTSDTADPHAHTLFAGVQDRQEPSVGIVSQGWRTRRRIASSVLETNFRFLDLTRAETFTTLERELDLGETEVDLSLVTSSQRAITQMISRWTWEQYDEQNRALFAGIKYVSYLDASWICWALFDGRFTTMDDPESGPIEPDDADLARVASIYRLKLEH